MNDQREHIKASEEFLTSIFVENGKEILSKVDKNVPCFVTRSGIFEIDEKQVIKDGEYMLFTPSVHTVLDINTIAFLVLSTGAWIVKYSGVRTSDKGWYYLILGEVKNE